MTIRYLIVTGGDAERRRAVFSRLATARDFVIGQVGDAFVIATHQRMLLPTGPMVIGEIFEGSEQVARQESITRNEGPSASTLLNRFWGRYVAIWSEGPERCCVLRDPSGALPCYYRALDGLTLVGSDLALLEQAMPARRILNWPEIARILGAGDLRGPATGLSGIMELPPGDMLTITGGRHETRSAWDPWDHMAPASSMSFEEQASLLRSRTEMVVTALGRPHTNSVATISGGLDSSIVALSLARLDGSLTGLTAFTDDPSGDERRYARIVADAASARYCERILCVDAIDLTKSQVDHLPRPTGRPFFAAVSQMTGEVAADVCASAVFNGTGGDNIFCFLQSVTPVVDRLYAGSPLGALRAVADVARMTDASYLEIAAATVRRVFSSTRSRRWRTNRRFLAPAQVEQASRYDHPWLAARRAARPGQFAHLTMLLRVRNYLEPWHADDPIDIINPLLAQPIVEHCLGIPSWRWCHGGVDRAVARQAFRTILPPVILERTWKGGPDGLIGDLVERNRTLLRERLLGGILATRELLDREEIDAVLSSARSPAAGDAMRLLALVDAENWVRYQGEAPTRSGNCV